MIWQELCLQRRPQRAMHFLFASAISLLLSGCGSWGSMSSTAQTSASIPGQVPLSCAQLADVAVPAASIGLPTTGAVVSAATPVAASGTGATATGSYCKVMGSIKPVDPTAPSIHFQLDMPDSWNHKVMMFGGGGYDGAIPTPEGNVPIGPSNVATPLERGYAVFASDSGHQANALKSQDGSFGVNAEALRNFSGDALKKTRDAAIYLINARYAVRGPARAYFAGGSSGGREALAVAQRWPQDWDGVIVLYPAWAAASLDLQFGRITQAFALPGAYMDPAKRLLLNRAVLAACDGLDGVKDGVVSNVAACNATFNPATATVDGSTTGAPLRCPNGADTGDTCLSDPQIAALNVYNTPITFGYPLASGETQYPGFNVYGADLGESSTSAVEPIVTFLGLGKSQPASPMPNTAPYMSVFWDQWVRFIVTGDPSSNSLTLNPTKPGVWQSKISQLTALQDVNSTDLTAFNAKGGKILMAHGTADVLVSTRSTEQYYRRLQTTMGVLAVQNFVRYYEIPGMGHVVGTAFTPVWDSLTTLENWVEHGTTPPAQTIADTAGVPGRTRPLCEYPTWPKYNGSGNVNAASSFSCVTQ
jgi:hypothetical protein